MMNFLCIMWINLFITLYLLMIKCGIKLWMKNNVSDLVPLCHLLYILLSLRLTHPYGMLTSLSSKNSRQER